MKQVKSYVLQIVICIVVALGSAIIWWRMWLYHGWIGSPQVLTKLLRVDGEASYNVVMIEMFIICLLIVCLVFIGLRFIRSTKWTSKM